MGLQDFRHQRVQRQGTQQAARTASLGDKDGCAVAAGSDGSGRRVALQDVRPTRFLKGQRLFYFFFFSFFSFFVGRTGKFWSGCDIWEGCERETKVRLDITYFYCSDRLDLI